MAADSLGNMLSTLDYAAKHWTLKCVNNKGRRRYECTVWMNGRRVTSNRQSIIRAIMAAMDTARGGELKLRRD